MSLGNDRTIPFLMGEDFVKRRNVAWRVELGDPHPENPLLEPEMPWDDDHPFLHGTVLRDPIDGRWKAWGTASAHDPYEYQARRLAFLESEDGVHWRRPKLELCPYGGHRRTNILLDVTSGGDLSQASVIVDPDADDARRYEMFVLRRPGWPAEIPGTDVAKGFRTPDGRDARERGIYRYTSSDGIRWNADVGPVLKESNDPLRQDATADSCYIFRQDDGSYVAYHKKSIRGFPGSIMPYELGPGGCRILVQRRSEDGVHWDPLELCMLPDWRDANDTQFMEMAVSPLSGGFVGIVTVYRTGNQTLEFQFAASRDGRYWWRPDRRACVSMPPLGDYGGGMMWGTHNLIEEGARLHYYYTGLQGLHGDIFSTEEADLAEAEDRPYKRLSPLHGEVLARVPSLIFFHGALCRASWRMGRLWALTTAAGGDLEGEATTRAIIGRGETLEIGAATFRDGELRAELVGEDGKAVEGFDRDACDRFSGDTMRTTMTWRGKRVAPADGLQVRFILRNVRLYGFEFKRPD